jgi:hypothetical protein
MLLSLNSLPQVLSFCWGCKGNFLFIFQPNFSELFQKIIKVVGGLTYDWLLSGDKNKPG